MAIEFNGPRVVRGKVVGLEVVDVVAINPSKAELEEYGFKVTAEPVYDVQRRVFAKIEGDKFIVSSKSASAFEASYEKAKGVELNTDNLEVINDNVTADAMRVTVVLKTGKGDYIRKSYEWFKGQDAYVPLPEGAEKLMSKNGFIATFRGNEQQVWNDKLKTHVWSEGDPKEYPYTAVIPTEYKRERQNGTGTFRDLLNLFKTFLLSIGAAEQGVSVGSKEFDLVGYLGGEDLISGNISRLEEILKVVQEKTKANRRGVFIVRGIAQDYKGRQFARIAEFYEPLTFNNKNVIQYPVINSKIFDRDILGTKTFTPFPVPTPAVEVTKEMQEEIQKRMSNGDKTGKTTKASNVSTASERASGLVDSEDDSEDDLF